MELVEPRQSNNYANSSRLATTLRETRFVRCPKRTKKAHNLKDGISI